MEKKMAELERQNFALKEEKYEIENQYLRSKITPHYLVNVVNSLQARAIKKTDDLPNLIAKLSAVLEYYMIFSSKEQVDINEEIIFYKNFIDLEILRHKEPLLLSFNVINIPKNCMIPPLLFENMIANAFKFVPQDESGYIKILFEFHDPNSLIFSCENNRWNNEINYQKHGTGLRNMEKRLKLLFGSAFMLTTTNLKDSFFIRLELKNLDKIKKECR
ncbi:MAG: histidine kinase [Bacteroidales bacterium]